MNAKPYNFAVSSGITTPFGELSLTLGHVRNILLALPPLYLGLLPFAFDLHVLTMPPAFALSQNQTLQLIIFAPEV